MMTRRLAATACTDSGPASGPSRAGPGVRLFPTTASPGQAGSIRVLADLTGSSGREFAEWLRTQLAVRRISQRYVAQRSGVDHATISRLVRGQRTPTLATAVKLARVLSDLGHGSDGPGPDGSPSGSPDPIARVEHALGSDERLDKSKLREIMEHYLALRDNGPHRPPHERGDGKPKVPGVSTASPAALGEASQLGSRSV
jgi:transcriptional regulator with XRE-family HTH domain